MKIISKIEALEKLKIGKPIIFQTDTLPAIGCMPKYSEMIYKVKNLLQDCGFDSLKTINDTFGIGRFTIGRYK